MQLTVNVSSEQSTLDDGLSPDEEEKERNMEVTNLANLYVCIYIHIYFLILKFHLKFVMVSDDSNENRDWKVE